MWTWGWTPVTRELPATVSAEALGETLEAAGFCKDESATGCIRFRRRGTTLTVRGERLPLSVEVASACATIRYDTWWILGDTGDRARLLERLIARAAQQGAAAESALSVAAEARSVGQARAMDAAEYKRTAASPDVFGAAELEGTVNCLRTCGSSLAEAIAEASRTPIPKPPLHRGGPDPDFFRVELPLELVIELVRELLDAEAAAVSPEGVSTPEASHRASLVDRWGRYQRWLEGRAA